MPTHEQMVSAVNAYFNGFEQQDAEMIAALFAEHGSVEDPVGSPRVQGQTAIGEFYQRAMSMNFTLVLDGPVRTAANYAAFPFSIHMNTPKGRRKIDVIDLFQFNDEGRIIEMRAFWGPQNNRRVDDQAD